MIYSTKAYNFRQKICRLLHFLAQFIFTNETELDYYHLKINARVVSRVAERILGILGYSEI